MGEEGEEREEGDAQDGVAGAKVGQVAVDDVVRLLRSHDGDHDVAELDVADALTWTVNGKVRGLADLLRENRLDLVGEHEDDGQALAGVERAKLGLDDAAELVLDLERHLGVERLVRGRHALVAPDVDELDRRCACG